MKTRGFVVTQLSWTFGLGVKGSTLKATALKLPRLLSSRRVEIARTHRAFEEN